MKNEKIAYIQYAQKKIGFKMASVYANMFVNNKHINCKYGGWETVLENCPDELKIQCALMAQLDSA